MTTPQSFPGHCFACQEKPKSSKELAHCSRCRYATYCSTACQKAHWNEHKALCNFIKQIPPFFNAQETRICNELIQRRVSLFQSFPEHCSEEEQHNIEMLRIRENLINDIQLLCSPMLSFLGLTMLMEGISVNMTDCNPIKALAFVQTPHALHLFLLFAQQIAVRVLPTGNNATRPYTPSRLIKRELVSIFRLFNQFMEFQPIVLHVISIMNEELPPDWAGSVLPSKLIEERSTIHSLLLFFMTEIDSIGDDLEGLAWQIVAFMELFVTKTKQMEENVTKFKNDLVRRKSSQGEMVVVTMKLFELAKGFALQILQSKGKQL